MGHTQPFPKSSHIRGNSGPGQQVHRQGGTLTLHTRGQALRNHSVTSNEDRCLEVPFSIGPSFSVIPPSPSLHPMI